MFRPEKFLTNCYSLVLSLKIMCQSLAVPWHLAWIGTLQCDIHTLQLKIMCTICALRCSKLSIKSLGKHGRGSKTTDKNGDTYAVLTTACGKVMYIYSWNLKIDYIVVKSTLVIFRFFGFYIVTVLVLVDWTQLLCVLPARSLLHCQEACIRCWPWWAMAMQVDRLVSFLRNVNVECYHFYVDHRNSR